MEISGLAMDNFPAAIAGNDSKTLRKLSLLEARMMGAGNESREASLPPNDGSRGSENNSNSMSTIGFGKPRSPGAKQTNSRGLGGAGVTKPKADPSMDDGGAAKRKHQRMAASALLGERNRQAPRGSGATAAGPGGATKGAQSHARRGSQGVEGGGSPGGAPSYGRLGARQSPDRPDQEWNQPSQKPVAGTPADALTTAGSMAQGADFSPPSDGRSGKGGGQAAPAGSTKTIQSYFYKPSNSTAVHNLAASYGTGEAPDQARAASALPNEVDLSGADEDSHRGELSFPQPMAKIGRSGSIGTVGGGGTGDGRSLQHRFAHAVSSAGDQDMGQVQQGHRQILSRAPGVGSAGGAVGNADGEQAGTDQETVEKLHERLQEAKALETQLRKELARANLERGSMETMTETLRNQLDRTMQEFKTKEAERDAQKKQLTSVVEDLLRKVAAQEASDCRAKLTKDMLELGKIVSVKTGHIGKYVEAFEEGISFKDVEKKTADMLSRKTKLEARKRAVSKLLKSSASATGGDTSSGHARLEAIEEEETVRMHLAALKREEMALQEEKRALDARKVLHIRELKRVAHEDRSKFARRPTLSGRYVLLNLLGKGGFSEVWRAFDLVLAEEVAVKVHQLLNNWNEQQKANFIRHVTREYEIHQQMRHPRIVNLTDVFEICCDSFATVLDYCRGTDLECLLRERKQLPERDARAVVLQVARGLQYLNTAQGEGENRRGAIIHYDLKPGNILLDENGDVKITDFGLSKILEIKKDTERGSGGGTSMELTSKGAGTYWYLPPECFGDNPRISSKVDVWSLGVIFYQILYGVRPFGEGLSQEKILREKVIVNANRVDFPPKPVVSEEAKSFIRSCLTYTHATRPDVHAMCNLPYLTTPAAKRGG
eukprot:g6838.t1